MRKVLQRRKAVNPQPETSRARIDARVNMAIRSAENELKCAWAGAKVATQCIALQSAHSVRRQCTCARHCEVCKCDAAGFRPKESRASDSLFSYKMPVRME